MSKEPPRPRDGDFILATKDDTEFVQMIAEDVALGDIQEEEEDGSDRPQQRQIRPQPRRA